MPLFLERWLPAWARETVLRENRKLRREVRRLQHALEVERAYSRGLCRGLGRRKEKTAG